MTIDPTTLALLSGVAGFAVALLVAFSFTVGVAVWGWSWAKRFDGLGAAREDDHIVLTAKLREKEPRPKRPRLKAPSNGVRKLGRMTGADRGQA